MINETGVKKLEAWQAQFAPWLAAQSPVISPGQTNHRMGIHLIGSREGDLAYAERLKPAAVKVVDPDPSIVRRMLNAIDPNGVVILRDHPMSEQKSDMAADPTGTGKRHANDWIAKLSTGRFAEFHGDSRIVVCGINEPDVHNEAEEQIVFLYTKAFLETLTAGGVRGLALNLSVGWPRNTGDGKLPVWDSFLPLEPIIKAGNHYLCVHEYFYPTIAAGWGWLCNRIAACPMQVPIIIGEVGFSKQVANAGLSEPYGWLGTLSPPTYAAELWSYHDKVDTRVVAILPFTSGFASPEWASMDILPAVPDILARVHPYKWETSPVEPPVEVDMQTIIFPKFTGLITGFYGQSLPEYGYSHEGTDLSAPTGQPIVAMADGVIGWSDTDPAYGEYIRLYCEKLHTSFFVAHLRERLVQTGDMVKQGQLIAYSDNTGNSSGPHIHFETRLHNSDGSYRVFKAGQPLYRQNGRVDALGWLAGWLAAGNICIEQ